MKKRLLLTFKLKYFFILIFLTCLFLSIVLFIFVNNSSVRVTAVKSGMPTIIIDAGHGGEDGGTQSSSGILEKDINLEISKKVNEMFRSLGYDTIMIRDDDSLIYSDSCNTMREKKVSDIHNRMDIINNTPNSIFLSIHQNHYSESKYNGAQVFYSPNNEKSMALAEKIQSSVVSMIQPENTRKVKKSGTEIYLLYHAEIPAVMVECGFLSNAGEAQLLNDEEYQKKISLAIISGVTEFLKGEGFNGTEV